MKYILFVLAGMLLISCYEQSNPIEDLYETDGREFPVISEWIFVDGSSGDTVNAEATLSLDLRYWSVPEITEIRLIESIDGDETVVESRPYTQNFNEESQTDQMVFEYTTPSVSEMMEVTLIAEIENEDNLIRRTGTGETGTRPSIDILIQP